MHHASLLILFACLAACSTPTGEPSTNTGMEEHIIDPKTLAGSWQDVQDSGRTIFRELWEVTEDGSMQGLGFVLSGQDTVFIEHLAIRPVNDTLHYTATINTQNNGGTIHFKQVHAKDSLVFTAPEHDFPQRIVYIPDGGDRWNVKVSGREKGLWVTDRLMFTRMPDTGSGPTP